MIRLFIGIPLPETLRQRLTLMQAGVPEARWVPPENLHLTLRFIGEVEEPVAQDIHDALSRLNVAAFPLTLRGAGLFSAGKRPRALWIGVEENPALNYLQSKVERAVQKAGLEPEHRQFTAHVTIARVSKSPLNRLESFIAEHDSFAAGPITIDQFALYESHLGKAQAHYHVVADYPLIGAML